MTSIVYTGTITSTIVLGDNGTITHPSGVSNVPFNTTFPNFNNLPIVWKTVPLGLTGFTLPQVLADRTYFTTFTTSVTLTGMQEFATFGNTTDSSTNIVYTDDVGKQIQVNYTVDFLYNYNTTTNLNSILPIFSIPTSISGVNIQISSSHYPATGMQIAMTVNVSASLMCTGNNINSQECMIACANGNPSCLPSYLNYCFPNTVGTDMSCQNYFADYIANNGPNAQIDAQLNQYCSSKYKGFGDLTKAGVPAIDVDLCSCHMPQETYVTLQNNIEAQVPALKAYPQIAQCFFSPCVNSRYHSQPIPKSSCAVPNCLIIGTFNNDGTFTNSQINESVSGCNSTTDTKTIEILVFVIILIIVIAIIIYYIYSSYSSSTSNNTPNTTPYVTTPNNISYNNTYVTS